MSYTNPVTKPVTYAVLVQTRDGRTVPHYFSHEGDARHYLAECESQGFQAVVVTQ